MADTIRSLSQTCIESLSSDQILWLINYLPDGYSVRNEVLAFVAKEPFSTLALKISRMLPWHHPAARKIDEAIHRSKMTGTCFTIAHLIHCTLCASYHCCLMVYSYRNMWMSVPFSCGKSRCLYSTSISIISFYLETCDFVFALPWCYQCVIYHLAPFNEKCFYLL